MADEFDLVVIGGGPGGSTAAAFVAMQGHRVLLLERDELPTYKIGESLLPSTVNGICAMLGVTEELRQANFVVKRGGTFKWGRDKEPWTFSFSLSPAMQGPTAEAYQVERMKFDTILLNNARRRGVEVRERHSAVEVLGGDHGRIEGLVYRDERGVRHEARSRFVIDASGWTSVLNRHVGTRIYSKFFRNLAVFGYFEHGGRLPPPMSGNIFCVAFGRGWFWYIPLSARLTSVGAVIGEEHADLIEQGPEQAYAALIDECPDITRLLSAATPATDAPYDKVRVRKEFSYCHSRFWTPGLALVGDAACFIDPVFSSGVHLSTYAALLAARSVNTCLRGRMTEDRAFTEYERRYLREYRYFYDFLVSFYDTAQDQESYYWSARRILGSGESANEAFIRLVGGIGGSGEQLYASADEFLRSRAELSQRLFPASTAGVSTDPAAFEFMTGLFSELGQIQARAVIGDRLAPVPLFDDGLVPTADGLHWSEPVH